VGNDDRGMAGSLFHGTLARDGTVIKALGAEVFEFAEERIKEIRDHHRVVAGNFWAGPFRLYR